MSDIKNEGYIEKQTNINNVEKIETVEELHIHQADVKVKLEKDMQSSEFWTELSNPDDIRNLKEKFLEVCNEFYLPKLAKYNRNLVEGKSEQRNYDDRDISSLKFIIFDKCQERLLAFCEKNKQCASLTKDDVEAFIEGYVDDAKEIISDKKKAYSYPNLSDDFIKKVVLDLIDECFLSFDEKGIYDE